MCAKSYRNGTVYVSIIASQRWDVFLRHGVYRPYATWRYRPLRIYRRKDRGFPRGGVIGCTRRRVRVPVVAVALTVQFSRCIQYDAVDGDVSGPRTRLDITYRSPVTMTAVRCRPGSRAQLYARWDRHGRSVHAAGRVGSFLWSAEANSASYPHLDTK